MKKLVIVGTGSRAYGGFAERLVKNFSGRVEIVGLCDPNKKRCEYFRDSLGLNAAIYKDFDLMLDELSPDAVLVTTPDGYHHEYIIRALDKGCDVYSEKPMTTTVEKCRAIREAEIRAGKKVRVTFNCRFMPYFAKLKELLAEEIIGKPLSVNYEYMLNPNHGGDYFKRWHRFMEMSGGMMVHKATHHFDIINWLLDDEPTSVCAEGARLYFGNESHPHGERCMTCPHKTACESYGSVCENDHLKKMYFDAEKEDGYQRDHCAFRADTDIYDSMSVSVSYKKGTLLTYSLNLFNTDEGFNMHIIGEKGRLEFSNLFEGEKHKITVRHRDGSVNEIYFPKGTGSHSGGDDRMMEMLFGNVSEDDVLGQCADSFDGIKSAMIGIGANKSIKDGIRVELTPILDSLR
ncbi:MAG: Gfo/Idh/MocA family oxidoreductase [Clostridia bacterium]|nr:Gfo/Idh/MocA family oxidoreductase [Clostridia bacterium]